MLVGPEMEVSTMCEARGIRNGVDVDELVELATTVAASADPVPVRLRTRSRWVDGAAFEGEGESLDLLGAVHDRARHAVTLDVPVALGGTDTGPAPTEVVLLALAACVGGTLVDSATLEGIDVDGLEVTVDGEFDLRGAFGVDGARPGLSGVSVTLRVRADVDDATLDEVGRESLRLSPTARSLTGAVPITVGVQRAAVPAASGAGSAS